MMDIDRELRELWELSFGDSPEYIDFFMNNKPESTRPYFEVLEDHIAGAVWGFECHIREVGPAVYAYALGTHPVYRHRYVASGLMKALAANLKASGKALCLLSADKQLCDFYKALGFRQLISRKRVSLGSGGGAPVAVSDVSDEEYKALRDEYFSWGGCICWDISFIRYAIRETRLCGGFAHKLVLGGKEYLLRGELRGNRLLIAETTMCDGELKSCAGSLLKHYGALELECLLPADSGLPGELEYTAFLSSDAPEGPDSLWIGFTLE
ncbi:MAG: GNAT family N-acetyltransferase [Oscillospiraceae bacterium]|jgi:ribosomal protein S18 acetylase RimI-like enzyme